MRSSSSETASLVYIVLRLLLLLLLLLLYCHSCNLCLSDSLSYYIVHFYVIFYSHLLTPSALLFLPSLPPSQLAASVSYLEYCVDQLQNQDRAIHNFLLSTYAMSRNKSKLLKYLTAQGKVEAATLHVCLPVPPSSPSPYSLSSLFPLIPFPFFPLRFSSLSLSLSLTSSPPYLPSPLILFLSLSPSHMPLLTHVVLPINYP